jgi:hypothetical protein
MAKVKCVSALEVAKGFDGKGDFVELCFNGKPIAKATANFTDKLCPILVELYGYGEELGLAVVANEDGGVEVSIGDLKLFRVKATHFNWMLPNVRDDLDECGNFIPTKSMMDWMEKRDF